jgi:hypothetical protein
VSFGLETLAEPAADILPIERVALGTVDDLASNEFARVRRSYLSCRLPQKLKPSLLRQRLNAVFLSKR